ncbi:MAG: hypothetical protein AAFO85_04890 [Cyanobacteria bacterium J06598_4]
MDYKSKIVAEVEALPESLLPELLNYVQNLTFVIHCLSRLGNLRLL